MIARFRNDFCFVALLGFMLSACSSNGTGSTRSVVCENVFNLVSDFNHRYPDQPNYMNVLQRGYYETYYYPQDNGLNCHYYLEFKSGKVIDEWGNYTCDGSTLFVSLPNTGKKAPVFSLYHSSTIDFFIIDQLVIDDVKYHLVYQAQYIFTTRG